MTGFCAISFLIGSSPKSLSITTRMLSEAPPRGSAIEILPAPLRRIERQHRRRRGAVELRLVVIDALALIGDESREELLFLVEEKAVEAGAPILLVGDLGQDEERLHRRELALVLHVVGRRVDAADAQIPKILPGLMLLDDARPEIAARDRRHLGLDVGIGLLEFRQRIAPGAARWHREDERSLPSSPRPRSRPNRLSNPRGRVSR